MDLALHPDTHDLFFDNDGHLTTVDGPQLFAQKLRVRLKRQLGEWIWDTTRGIPYREQILVRSPDTVVAAAYFKATILETPGALRLERFDLEIDEQTMRVDFVVVTEWGPIEAFGERDDLGALALTLLLQPQGAIL